MGQPHDIGILCLLGIPLLLWDVDIPRYSQGASRDNNGVKPFEPSCMANNMLQHHLNRALVSLFMSGLTQGFCIGFSKPYQPERTLEVP